MYQTLHILPMVQTRQLHNLMSELEVQLTTLDTFETHAYTPSPEVLPMQMLKLSIKAETQRD